MKKLTATIFATLLTVVSVNAAHASIASRGYVDNQLKNKADTSTVSALKSRVDTVEGEVDANTAAIALKEDKSKLKTLAYKDTVSAAEIDANAVTTEKILDANVTKTKLASDVQASLNKADTALQSADLTDYMTKEAADAAYATKETEGIASTASSNASQALTDIGTKSTLTTTAKDNLVNAINEVDAALNTKADSSDISDMLTKTEASTTYATQESLTSGLADKLDVDGTAAKATADADGNVITTTYATKTELTSGLEGKVDDAEISDMLTKTEAGSTYATKSQIADMQTKTNMATAETVVSTDKGSTTKYTSVAAAEKIATDAAAAVSTDVTELEGRVDTVEGTLKTKADKATNLAGYGITDAYTKTEVDGKLEKKADSSALADYATKTELTDGLGTKADKTAIADMLTKTEAGETYETISNAKATYATKEEIADMATEENLALKQDKTDNSLGTTNKTVVGAINEVKTTADSAKKVAAAAIPAPVSTESVETGTLVLTYNTSTKKYAWESIER